MKYTQPPGWRFAGAQGASPGGGFGGLLGRGGGGSWLDRQQGWFPWWEQNRNQFGGDERAGRSAYDTWFDGGGAPAAAPAASPGAAFGGSNQSIIDRVMGSKDPESLLPDLLNSGMNLAAEGERRRTETLGYLKDQKALADKPTLTDEDIRRWSAQESDRITGDASRQRGDLRAMMGAAGITGGGMPTAQLARIQLQRMGQVIGSRANLRMEKARADALDRAAAWERSQPVAGLMNEDPNMIGHDTLTSALEYRSDRYGYDQQRAAAEAAAKAQRSGAKTGLFGQILGGVLSALPIP